MKKLRPDLYRVALPATLLAAFLGVLLGVLAAIVGSATLLGWAVALCSGSIVGLALCLHIRTARILRFLRPSASNGGIGGQPSGIVDDRAIFAELQELRKSIKLSVNNEMFLIDEIQRLNAKLADDR